MVTKIIPQPMPFNAVLANYGRGAELLNLREKLLHLTIDSFGRLFHTRKHQRRLTTYAKVQRHTRWYFKAKYPDMPIMYAKRIKLEGELGWLIYTLPEKEVLRMGLRRDDHGNV